MLDALLHPLRSLLPTLLASEAAVAAGVPGPALGAAPAGDAPPGVGLGGESVSLLDYIRAGGVVSYLLVIISVVALALVVRNLLVLRMRVLAPEESVSGLDALLADARFEEAAQFCVNAEPESFLTRVLARAFERCTGSPFGFLEFRGAVEEAAQTEGDELHRLNDGLGIIAAIGPMLGLLGTVFGMIGAFRTIGSLEGAARSSQLSVFMSMALVNTAQGLIVAVPCTVAFALFRRHIDRSLRRVGDVLERAAQSVALASGSSPTAPAQPRTLRTTPAGATAGPARGIGA